MQSNEESEPRQGRHRSEAGSDRTVRIPWVMNRHTVHLDGIGNVFYIGLANGRSEINLHGSDNTLYIGAITGRPTIYFGGSGNILVLSEGFANGADLKMYGADNVRINPFDPNALNEAVDARHYREQIRQERLSHLRYDD